MNEFPPAYKPNETSLSFLYVDGGVIKKNPSPIGGTWAIRIIEEKTIHDAAGVVIPSDFGYNRHPSGCEAITNNIAEMLALVMGLRRLPREWIGIICSDSEITIGRATRFWKWKGIPLDLYNEFGYQRGRLVNWEKFRFIGLSGHPTEDDLKVGFRADTRRPVSRHNVWCDEMCKLMAQNYLNGGVTRLEDVYDRTTEAGCDFGGNEKSLTVPEGSTNPESE